MKSKNKVIAIVVTFNRKALLLDVINGLLSQTKKLERVIIVDNCSSDGTKELVHLNIEKWNSCGDVIEYVDTGDNLGGAGGFNFGFDFVKKFNFDYLWLMDDDLLPHSDCLEKLLLSDFSGIVQPTRFNLDGSCAELSPVEYNLNNPFLLNPKKKSVKDVPTESRCELMEIDGIAFEGPLISKDVVDAVGNPKADFFIFYDDLEYALRAKQLGFNIYSSKSAKCTRLLMNNQKNDLASWKGYFMLRNFFHIHFFYGKNPAVKFKPYVMAACLWGYSLLKLNMTMAKTVLAAIRDAKTLANNEIHKPQAVSKL